MKMFLNSTVSGNYKKVYAHFDEALFAHLAPPSAVAEIKKFEGSEVGNLVEIYFKWPLNSLWVSEITQTGNSEKALWFIDEGKQLPLGLRFWRHKHVVLYKSENTSLIQDEMEFDSGNIFWNMLLYPVLYLSFLPRIWLYKSYFKNNSL